MISKIRTICQKNQDIISNKSKIADTKWKIKTFKQGKKHIVDFMIKFEVLAMKAETNNVYTILLLNKNIRTNIIWYWDIHSL